jgi:hypothetical protein
MSGIDDEIILEHLRHIRAVTDEIRQDLKDIIAICDRMQLRFERSALEEN